MMLKVKFRGQEYYLTDGDRMNGPVATREQYQSGTCSFAHIFNGQIYSHGVKIGTSDEFGDIEEVEDLEMGDLYNLLTHPSWEK